jgi:hypothetical protein
LNKLAIAANQMTVRIHTGIVTKYQRWTKLWYFLRGLDVSSSGFGSILVADICHWLGAAPSTVRQWFREGKAAGAFRCWSERRGIITTAVGSPAAVCLGLKLYKNKSFYSIRRAWGEVSEIPLVELDRLRAHATAVTIQSLQNHSHFAAKIAAAKDPDNLRVPTPADIFEAAGRASLNPNGRALLPFVSKISANRIWVSKSFRAFGVNQTSVGAARGFCDRTIRNHLSLLGVESRQIVQAKGAYRQVAAAIDRNSQYFSTGEGKDEVTLIGYVTGWNRGTDQPVLEHKLSEGLEGDFPEGGIETPRSRFFPAMGKWWLYRCNLYNLNYPLHSANEARNRWFDRYYWETYYKENFSKNRPAPIQSETDSLAFGYSEGLILGIESEYLVDWNKTLYYIPPEQFQEN